MARPRGRSRTVAGLELGTAEESGIAGWGAESDREGGRAWVPPHSPPPPPPDGAYLTVGSHDNLVYVYTVDQGGRKVSRLGKCSVSGQWPPARAATPSRGCRINQFSPSREHSFNATDSALITSRRPSPAHTLPTPSLTPPTPVLQARPSVSSCAHLFQTPLCSKPFLSGPAHHGLAPPPVVWPRPHAPKAVYPSFSPLVFSPYLCILPSTFPGLIPPRPALTPPLPLPPQGHSSFITHLDWARDSSCFVTNSGDYEILYCEFSKT